MKTVITVSTHIPLEFGETAFVWHGLGIDEEIDKFFYETQPHLIKDWTTGDTLNFERIYDLPAGTHTLYYRNTYPFATKSVIFINDIEYEHNIIDLNYLKVVFDVVEEPLEPIRVHMIPDGEVVASIRGAYDICQDVTLAMSNFHPLPWYLDVRKPVVYGIYATGHFPEFKNGQRNLVWWGLPNYRVKTVTCDYVPLRFCLPGLVSCQNWAVGKCEKYWNLARIFSIPTFPVEPTEPLTVAYGHISEEGEKRIRRGERLLDEDFCEQGTENIRLKFTGVDAPNYYGSLEATIYAVRLSNPIRPDIDTEVIVFMLFRKESGVVPFFYILETEPSQTIFTGDNLATRETIIIMAKGFYLNSKIIEQGYFTVVYGRVIPEPPVYEELGQIQVRVVIPSASIQNVSLSMIKPRYFGRIESVSLSPIAINAQIQKPVPLSMIKPPYFGRIEYPVTFSPITAPPPERYATLSGKVLSLIGVVADAEVSLDNIYTTRTGRDGSFMLQGIPLGSYTLTVNPTKTLDRILFKATSKPVDLLLPTGYTETITLPLNYLNLSLIMAAGITIPVAATKIRKPPEYYY